MIRKKEKKLQRKYNREICTLDDKYEKWRKEEILMRERMKK